jgi:hypothetical protein
MDIKQEVKADVTIDFAGAVGDLIKQLRAVKD